MSYNNQTISTHSFYSNPKRNLKGGNSASLNTLSLASLNRDDKRPSSSHFSTPFRKKNFASSFYDRRSSPKCYPGRRTSPPYHNRSPHKKYDSFSYGRNTASAGNSRKRKLFSESRYFRDDKPMKKSRSSSEEDYRKPNNSPNNSFNSFQNDQQQSNQPATVRNPFNVNHRQTNGEQVNLLFRDEKSACYRNGQPSPVTLEEVRKGEDKENAINAADQQHPLSDFPYPWASINKLHRLDGNNLDEINRQLDSPKSISADGSNYLCDYKSGMASGEEHKSSNYSLQHYRSSSGGQRTDSLYPVALRNLGNTCYMNSIVQPLFNLPFLMCELRDSMERANLIDPTLNFSMTKSLVELFEEYKRMRKTQSNNDEELEKRLCAFKHNVGMRQVEFKSSGQHDAVEFLDAVINSIDEEFDKVKKTITNCKNPVDKVFKIELGEASHCEACNLKSNIVKNKSHCLILSLPDEKYLDENPNWNLQQILRNYFKPEKREATCEKCGNKERNRYLSVLKSPRVLILQLGRYTSTIEKRHEPIKVPFEITLPKVHTKESRPRSAENPPKSEANPDNKFELSGVICHHGSCMAGGHYVCYVHDRLNNEWYHCDDENILQTTFDRVQEGSKSSGYCFFYLNKKYI